ncbi:MAG TPA: hypothetical protein VGP56_07600 [Gaiellaceae bacterium]|jgi:hypothetical protein|nr:hypothetical protein [Gaiellaceae bacterium]
MRRLAAIQLAVAAGVVVALAGSAGVTHAARSSSPACSPAPQPAWIDYGDKWVPFRHLFFQPGLTVALAHDAASADARRGGAQLAFWDMSLRRAVGTPARPADPRAIPAAAARVLEDAVRVTGCSTPVIGLNELFGAQRTTPWRARNARYRADVLALVQGLAAAGGQPQLFISQAGATTGTAARWWRAVAQAATIVRELYLPAPWLHAFGPGRGSEYMRFELRRAVRNLTTIGVPSSRVGIALGFQSGRGGRMGLAAAPWFQVVKRETLATRHVAGELGLASVWSWGWATFPGGHTDPDTRRAACVFLWTREAGLCDGPAAAGSDFDRSLAQPAEGSERHVSLRLLSSRHPVWFRVAASAKLAARAAFLQERRAGTWHNLQRLLLGPLHPRPLRVPLSNGRHLVRLYVAAENAPHGEAFSTAPRVVRVH